MAVVTSNDLVIKAFNIIAVYSPRDIPRDEDINYGIDELNDILASFGSDGQMIPFRQKVTFPLISGQNSYIFSDTVPADVVMPPIVELSECNITFNDVILPCLVVPYSNIVNTSRVTKLEAIPGTVYLQRHPDSSELFFYPAPSPLINLVATIYAKFYLTSVTRFQEMTNIPPYFVQFLKYQLARNLRSSYPTAYWTESAEDTYQELLKKIKSSNDMDMSIQGDCLLTRTGTTTTQSLLGLLPVAGH